MELEGFKFDMKEKERMLEHYKHAETLNKHLGLVYPKNTKMVIIIPNHQISF